MAVQRRWLWGPLVVGVLIGCSRSPEARPGTGAKECAQAYYAALIQKDWPKAYAALDPQDRRRYDFQDFSRLAQSYRSSLGFDPKAMHVRACEERSTEATAHVVLTGRTTTKERRYKDAVTLRRADDGWRVILPHYFGRANKR